ncbi:MAG: type VI secretion system protein TssL, long form [Rhodospirillales bacterium]
MCRRRAAWRIIIFNRGLFPSGGAEVGPQAEPLIRKIALFLAERGGPVQVNGYTDNVPIRTLRFPSNWHLSKARAAAVAAMMAPPLDPARLRIEGRADNEPLESNDTAEGRSQNRRVEIQLPLS